jgi:hypothetical protein
VFEQFIRQSSSIPTNPIVVFTESSTPNWSEKECTEKPVPKHTNTKDEIAMLKLLQDDPMKIPTEINKDEPKRAWPAVLKMFQSYKTSGIQVWSHDHYLAYKCHGPYVKTWYVISCCATQDIFNFLPSLI